MRRKRCANYLLNRSFSMGNIIFPGYNSNFLAPRQPVAIPQLSTKQQADTLAAPEHLDGLLHHANYTVALSASRGLAWYSAANVDASKFQQVARRELSNYWRREKALPKERLTLGDWYKLSEKKLQRGHMTPADCMEWGLDREDAITNANTTFYYSNAVPQIQRLNGREWGMLERYIGEECVKAGNGRLCVHTGPVLRADDPVYVHQIGDRSLQIPVLFWKVIWYLDPQGQLSRIGFIMSQSNLLKASELLEMESDVAIRKARVPGPFEELGNYKTYQVGVKAIQQLTGLGFAAAQREPYPDERPIELMMREIDVPVSFTPATGQGVAERGLLPSGKKSLRILVGLEL